MKKSKLYWEMNKAELRAATREFDAPIHFSKTKPLTASDRAAHAKARRRGRPQVGAGSRRITTTIERGLLAQVDAAARKRGQSRAALIAAGLRTLLATA